MSLCSVEGYIRLILSDADMGCHIFIEVESRNANGQIERERTL